MKAKRQLTTREFVAKWVEDGETVRTILAEDGPKLIERVMKDGRSLRSIARRTGLSPAYLSRVKSGDTRISPTAYLSISRLDR